MAVSTTTFEERIARIQKRAAKGDNVGFVQPGVAEEPITPRAAKTLSKRSQRSRGGYLASVLGGLFTSAVIVGVGAVVLLAGTDTGEYEQITAALFQLSE